MFTEAIDQYSARLVREINADPKNPNLPRMLHHHLNREGCKPRGIFVVVDNVNYNLESLYMQDPMQQWQTETDVHIFLNYQGLQTYLLRSVDLLKIRIDEVGWTNLTPFTIDEEEFSSDFIKIEELIEEKDFNKALEILNGWLGRIAPENDFTLQLFDKTPE